MKISRGLKGNLIAARDYIQAYGLNKGVNLFGKKSKDKDFPPASIVGAMSYADGYVINSSTYFAMYNQVQKFIPLPIEKFNTLPATSKEDVISVFNLAIDTADE